MALTYSQTINFGAAAPDFSLPGIDGKTYSLTSFKNAKILVVIFMCNHCPYVQACWDRLIALQKKFGPRGVQLIGINSNDAAEYPDDSFEKMKEYAAARSQNFPYLRDESQSVARAYGAVCTPDIFVYERAHSASCIGESAVARSRCSLCANERVLRVPRVSSKIKRRLAYHGRIDDNWKEPEKVTRRELAEAIEALLQAKKPSRDQNPSMGC